jgi:hypothetical protein
MSSTIEFDRYIIKSGPESRPFYFGFVDLGESNVIDDAGKVSRSTRLVQVNHYDTFMHRVIDISTDCEGGMLKMHGRKVKPEGYIAAWRKSVDREALALGCYLQYANLDISFHSLVKQLEARRRKLLESGTPYMRQLAKGIDDLIIRLCTTDGIVETVEQPRWMSEPVAITRFMFSLANQQSLLDLMAKAFSHGVDGRRIWNWNRYDGLSFTAWRRGHEYQNKLRASNAA